MAIHVALAISLAGTLALAGMLLAWADQVAGARLLVAFLCGVAVWIIGNELPTWAGPGTERLALALLATASTTAAAFLHFSVVFCARPMPRAVIAAAYALGGAATLLSAALPSGTFQPFAGMALVAVPNAVGWVTSVVWAVLAGCGQLVLLQDLRRRHGLARRQVAAVSASSAWGLLSMSGYAIAALDLPLYPWPLLLLPAYPVILVYGILRYRVFVANAWARRALVWSMLAGAALLIVALVPLLPLEGAAGRLLSGALVAAACLTLAGPARRLAERLVYPGGTVSAEDFEYWRTVLSRADTPPILAEESARLLRARLGVAVGVSVGGAPPALPGLACHRTPAGWRTALLGWDAAPPGPRRLAGLFGTVLAQEAARLERASTLAERERERQTQARLAELGQLAAAVAHDVRNPLNIIAMAAAAAPPEVRQDIAQQVDRIARLARDLLDYAKPWHTDPVPLDLSETVRAALRRYPAAAIGPGLGAPLPVRADPRRLDQALTNLLDNARATGAPIEVAADAAAGRVRLHVCDRGPGVPADLRDRLFQPFVSRGSGGTGLGLAIVARIMAAHGGTAALTDRPGWSTSITLDFPAPEPGGAVR